MSDSEIFVSVGRRKTSVARVRLGKGSGKILVNEKPVAEYCYTDQLRMIATRPRPNQRQGRRPRRTGGRNQPRHRPRP